MSDYRRLISYIYAYEGGVKGRNIGFAKLEARGGQCKIQVSVRKIYVGSQDVGVYLLAADSEIPLGKIFLRGGSGEFRTVVLFHDVNGSGRSMDQCYGLTLHSVDDAWRCYTTIWEDAVAHAAAVELEEATSENAETKEMERLPASEITEKNLKEMDRAPRESVAEEIEREIGEMKERPSASARPIAKEPETSQPAISEAGTVQPEIPQPQIPEPEPIQPEKPRPEVPQPQIPEAGTVQPEMPRPEVPQPQISEPGTVQSEVPQPEVPQTEIPKPEMARSEAPQPQIPEVGTVQPEAAQQAPGTEEKQPNGPEIPFPDSAGPADRDDIGRLWNHFQRHYPKIQAFDYHGGCEILLIKPQDIGLLPRETWGYGNNSFLLHGYYNHRYLILARLASPEGAVRFLLGVPGHYYSNEKYMASMFGFPNFVLSKMQPAGDGRFGYWYTDIRLTEGNAGNT